MRNNPKKKNKISLIYLGFFYKLLNKYLLNVNKKGKFFYFIKINYYFYFLKLYGFNFKFFFVKNLIENILYIGYGYDIRKKLRFPKTFKIPVKIKKGHQCTITLRLFSMYSSYEPYILLMYLNVDKYFFNDLIIDYQEKILEDKYYII